MVQGVPNWGSRLVAESIVALCIASCSTQPEPTPEGVEGGRCYANRTCNSGLSCLSNLCVHYDATTSGGGGNGGLGSGTDSSVMSGAGGEGGSVGGASGLVDSGGITDVRSGDISALDASSIDVSTSDVNTIAEDARPDVVFVPTACDSFRPVDGGSGNTCVEGMCIAYCVNTQGGLDFSRSVTSGTTFPSTVDLTVSGLLVFSTYVQDPFYMRLTSPDASTSWTASPQFLIYNQDFEGCLCTSGGCMTHRVSTALTGAYPPFSPTHEYSVQIYIGNGPHRIGMSISECLCDRTNNVHAGALSATIISPEGTCTHP